ncbi:MAG: riboflavin synthase [Gammaproteobacteria bacterium]|nr:riboflavin synthase [Gammaproteobacteria bacterium]
MYTGIVQALLPVTDVEELAGLKRFHLDFLDELLQGLELGASVGLNGVCLTVTAMEGARVTFEAIAETLRITNLSGVAAGTLVNIERSAKAGVEVGGHVLAGHIVATAPIISVSTSENNRRLTFRGEADWLKYVFDKGFLALNGASLTVADLDRDGTTFSVNLIPETLRRTNFANLREGDEVNVEVDQQTQAIVDTVERVLAERALGV